MFFRLSAFFALACVSVFGAPAVEFEWASPHPHRLNWLDMAAGNGRFVGIAGGNDYYGRHIYSSKDGRSWTLTFVPGRRELHTVRFHDGAFFGFTIDGALVTSPDGETWKLRSVTGPVADVAAGDGVTVLTLSDGTILRSTDLENWEPVEGFADDKNFHAVEFGNGRFVAVGGPGHVHISADGTTWTQGTWPSDATLTDNTRSPYLVFSNGRFAMSANAIFTTVDGLEWEHGSTNVGKLVPASNGFFAVSSIGPTTRVMRSSDGREWQTVLEHFSHEGISRIHCAAEQNGVAVAGGVAGLLFRSTGDGPWEMLVGPPQYSRSEIAFGGGEFLRFGRDPGVELSRDGSAWEIVPDAPALKSAVHGKGVWVGVRWDNALTISTNGRVWRDVEGDVRAFKVHFANGIFLGESRVVPQGGSTNAAIATSRDGRNWRLVSFPKASYAKIIGYANGRWAARIDVDVPATSVDGENWTVHPWQANMRGAFYAAGNGRFISMGGAGMGPSEISWSEDGINWHPPVRGGSTFMERSLSFGGGIFVLTDWVGGVLVSHDGLDWSHPGRRPVQFDSSACGNGLWLVSGADAILRAPVQWEGFFKIENGPVSGLSLRLFASAGQRFELQSAPSLSGGWRTLRTVDVPNAGVTSLPIESAETNHFYRAIAAQP